MKTRIRKNSDLCKTVMSLLKNGTEFQLENSVFGEGKSTYCQHLKYGNMERYYVDGKLYEVFLCDTN